MQRIRAEGDALDLEPRVRADLPVTARDTDPQDRVTPSQDPPEQQGTTQAEPVAIGDRPTTQQCIGNGEPSPFSCAEDRMPIVPGLTLQPASEGARDGRQRAPPHHRLDPYGEHEQQSEVEPACRAGSQRASQGGGSQGRTPRVVGC